MLLLWLLTAVALSDETEEQQGRWVDAGTTLQDRSYVLTNDEADTVAGWLEERRKLLKIDEGSQRLEELNEQIISDLKVRIVIKDDAIADRDDLIEVQRAELKDLRGPRPWTKSPWFKGSLIAAGIIAAGIGIDYMSDREWQQ